MWFRKLLIPAFFILLAVLLGWTDSARAGAAQAPSLQTGSVSRYDLILAMNTMRVSNGLSALIEDPIVNAVAQATAEIMAANNMSWHIGDVRGRIAAAGYGSGATVWATENFAVGRSMSIDQIMLVWADPDHMRPATNPAYCHVGAGVARANNGSIYYVLQAAYTSDKACGKNVYPAGSPGSGGTVSTVPQIIIPVKVATPDIDGKVYHEVKSGQSFWSIAVAYKVTIADIEFWNNVSRERPLFPGQRLFIPSAGTEGFATPTPVGMVVKAPPDSDGKIVHIVQPYQTLIGISKAYNVSVDKILVLNGWSVDWPLQVEQKLLIDPGKVTPSPTPRPLTPLEKLTPAADGKYYHVVSSGETLSWIAGLYEVSLADLMAWNSLNSSSIIQPDQRLLLQVTPPATETPTPAPATITPTPTDVPPTMTPSITASLPAPSPTPGNVSSPREGADIAGWFFGVGLAVVGVLLLMGVVARRRTS